MREFRDKVAVVTGAASGIGKALAARFAAEGMKVVLADVEHEALAATVDGLRAGGATALAVPTDVSQAADVEALAARTLEEFGVVHIVCNNAGVIGRHAPVWQQTAAEWQWVYGVNLWGVIHGVNTFVPILLRQGGEAHIVNTASEASFTARPFTGVYNSSKHAVLALSESLALELALQDARLKVSVLCPGGVNTRILDADRNRPAALRDPDPLPRDATGVLEARMRRGLAAAMDPAEVADSVIAGIRDEAFYIFSHPQVKQWVRAHADGVIEGHGPVTPVNWREMLKE